MNDSLLEFGLIVTAPPETEPVTLDQAKAHLKVDGTDEDDDIELKIAAAREFCEGFCHRAFITTEFLYALERFPRHGIVLPRPRLQTVDSVSYLDGAGDRQTLTPDVDYLATTAREPAKIVPPWGRCWPVARQQIESVQVEYTSGYGDSSEDVPPGIKAAIMLVTQHLYDNRSPVVTGTIATTLPMSVYAMLLPFKRPWRQ